MKGIAIEDWHWKLRSNATKWLEEHYGPRNKNTWYEQQDYDFVDLVMNDKIYTMFALRWL